MNLFVLPSWYPSATNPMAGAFILDQVRALAAYRPELEIAVGLWGHHDGALSLRDPGASLRAFGWRARARESWKTRETAGGHWHESFTPRLSWTLAWARGGADGLLSATRRNLDRAEAALGKFDLIHAHVGFPGGWIASVLAEERGIPYVLTEHMGPFPVRQLMRDGHPNADLRRAFGRAHAVIAVSPALASAIRRQDLPCTDVIPNVVRSDRFAAAAGNRPAPHPFVILSVGALRHAKGMDLLIDALALWRPGALDVQLHIAGEGPERAALEARAARLGLTGQVRFLGQLHPDEVPAVLSTCHAFALASRHETFGVVLAEALMAGRPVLATRCGGPEAIVGPGDGILVESGNVEAIARGLAQVHELASVADPHAIRTRAVARFGPDAVSTRLVQVYERALKA